MSVPFWKPAVTDFGIKWVLDPDGKWAERQDHVAEVKRMRALEIEVERLNRHRDELSADRHRHLLEIRALDAEAERLRAVLEAEVERLTAERDELREALVPFARAADWDWSKTVFGTADDAMFSYNNRTDESITLGDLRRARAALESNN